MVQTHQSVKKEKKETVALFHKQDDNTKRKKKKEKKKKAHIYIYIIKRSSKDYNNYKMHDYNICIKVPHKI